MIQAAELEDGILISSAAHADRCDGELAHHRIEAHVLCGLVEAIGENPVNDVDTVEWRQLHPPDHSIDEVEPVS